MNDDITQKTISEFSTTEDKIKALWKLYPSLMDCSDLDLILMLWKHIDGVDIQINPAHRERMTTPETITRCRRLLQARYPQYRSSEWLKAFREKRRTIIKEEVV